MTELTVFYNQSASAWEKPLPIATRQLKRSAGSGVTNWVCEPEELGEKTRENASRLATGPTVVYRYMKEKLNRAIAGDVGDCLDLEATHHTTSTQA